MLWKGPELLGLEKQQAGCRKEPVLHPCLWHRELLKPWLEVRSFCLMFFYQLKFLFGEMLGIRYFLAHVEAEVRMRRSLTFLGTCLT